LAVDESRRRGAFQQDFKAPVLLLETDTEILVAPQHVASVIRLVSGIEYRQQAAPKERVQASLSLVPELLGFRMGKDLEAALRPHFGIDRLVALGPYSRFPSTQCFVQMTSS